MAVKFEMGLGSWRFFLALLVATSHLWADMIHGPAAYAVWGFFVLSGYLMTLILSTRYDRQPDGLKRYAFNRFMRIYPSYAVACALGLLTVWWLGLRGVDPTQLNPQFQNPQGVVNWIAALGMIPFLPVPGLPVPVAGALFVEVWAYALMPLLARSRGTAWAALLIALAANQQYGFATDSFVVRYVGFATGMLPFAAGSLACHYREALARVQFPRLSILVWCVHGIYWLSDPSWPWTYGLGLSVLLSAWVVVSLGDAKTGAVDKWLGELSYPLYLLHTMAGAWLMIWFGPGRPFTFFAWAMLASLVGSWVMVRLVDRPLQKLKMPA
jgi:peptidoglycan/LPS O-acetylase OafA/YrhL